MKKWKWKHWTNGHSVSAYDNSGDQEESWVLRTTLKWPPLYYHQPYSERIFWKQSERYILASININCAVSDSCFSWQQIGIIFAKLPSGPLRYSLHIGLSICNFIQKLFLVVFLQKISHNFIHLGHTFHTLYVILRTAPKIAVHTCCKIIVGVLV